MKCVKRLTAAQQRLVEENLAVVERVLRFNVRVNPCIVGLSYEDLYQEGCVWLCKAALTFDPARGSFASYARQVVQNGLVSYCRNLTGKQSRMISLAEMEPTALAALKMIKKPRVIQAQNLYSYRVVAQSSPFSGALAMQKVSRSKTVFSDAFKEYNDPYKFLQVLKGKDIPASEYYKYFVNITYEVFIMSVMAIIWSSTTAAGTVPFMPIAASFWRRLAIR